MKRRATSRVPAAAALALLALSCGSENVGGPDARPWQITTSASYSVPVPEELVCFSTYPVARVGVIRDDGRLTIGYRFPPWLGGITQRIELEGAYASEGIAFEVTAGELGSGSCVQTGRRFECSERLPGVEVDRAQARAWMLEAGLSALELEQRLRVTELFATDPIGMVVFEFSETAAAP